MSVSIVIPQVFYDIIARVLPGYLFLYALGASIYDDVFWFAQLNGTQANSIYTFFMIVSFFILSYFAGWILRTISFYGMDRMMAKEDLKAIREKYQIIRLKNPAAGFRIIKLRAEIRMLEASRNGCILVVLISVLQPITNGSYPSWTLIEKILILLILAMIFQRAMQPAFKNYIGNIISVYEIINKLQAPDQSEI